MMVLLQTMASMFADGWTNNFRAIGLDVEVLLNVLRGRQISGHWTFIMGPLEIYRVPRQVKRSGAPETPNFVMHVQAFHLTF